jgi:hypothetical protein
LLRDKQVIGDMQGGTAIATNPGDAVEVYFQPLGRYLLSLEPMKGAVEGKVRMNRIAFELNGQENIFVSGTPVTRGYTVWVLYEPDFKPTGGGKVRGYIASGKVSIIAPEAVPTAWPSNK